MNPPKENAAWGSGAERTVDGKETATPILPIAENLSKRFSTLQARLALRGYEVTAGQCGDFLVSKNGVSYYSQDLDTLTRIAKELGA